MSLPPPTTPRSKAGATTAVTSPADVQVVTSTISDDHTLSAKASDRPMPLDQTFPLKPAVRQSSSADGSKHLSPTGSGDTKSRPKQKRVAFAEDRDGPAAMAPVGEMEPDFGGQGRGYEQDGDADDIEFDEVFEEVHPPSARDDLDDATFELDEDIASSHKGQEEKEDEYYPPTLEEAARMLSDDGLAEGNTTSEQAIGIAATPRSAGRDPTSASNLSSSIRMAGSFSQFMHQQSHDGQLPWKGDRLQELASDNDDPSLLPSPPTFKEIGRPIYEGASQAAEPLSTSHVGSYIAYNQGRANEGQSQQGRPRPGMGHLRRPSAGAEVSLNHIIGANVSSHRAMWQASRRGNKYALSEEDNKRWADWQQRGNNDENASDSGALDLSRSVPAGPAFQQQNLRGGLFANDGSAERIMPTGGGVAIPSRTPSRQEQRDAVDREAKTSLPYNERLFVPSYMKAISNLSTSRLGRSMPRQQLSVIEDEGNLASSSSNARLTMGFNAPVRSKDRSPHATTSQRSDVATPMASAGPGARVPFLAARPSERREKLLARRYQAPPPPTSSADRLVPAEEDAPAPLPVFSVPAQPTQKNPLPGISAIDYEDADNQSEGVLKFMHRMEMLKKNKRTGWYHHRVEHPESIGDHMYRMAILAMLGAADDSGLDVGKCVMMALTHDMAEAEVGDLTPRDHVDKVEKTRREAEAIEYLTYDLLGGSRAGQRIESLWNEYEERKTPEARFVKDLDRFELCLQALEYEREHDITDLQPFYRGAIGNIEHPVVRAWAKKLAEERQELWVERGKAYEQPIHDERPGSSSIRTPASVSSPSFPTTPAKPEA
ncbi:hypothetical protein OC846_000176 [Tilletia horrida]|uniref:5'-deoxynucleotidase n=1 Tax=Tilletia horrida TaxID=155126 RepID=A0AAN6GWA8_9BASI|nr:hypothetical protein OC845_000456 [Tilletia horrida]KAK0557881.1 hypothetical protein OC846_000176 [Tilletia horrida]